MRVNFILGTMTIGQQAFDADASTMIDTALSHGITELDTAYVYNEGECERVLGRVLKNVDRSRYTIATKVNPRVTGRMDRESVFQQLNESLQRLQLEKADVLYLHFPDPNTPIEETLAACAALHEQGKFTELGLSNYPAWLVADIWNKCTANGWVRPTVYEGVYNALSRNAEGELFDALRNYGMRFTAYNPLAGGLLTGKYTNMDQIPSDSRFAMRKGYQNRYWKESYFKAVDIVRNACSEESVLMVDAALRWLAFHSELQGNSGDCVIIGASKPAQLVQNLQSLDHGPLPQHIVDAYDQAWDLCRNDAPKYYRFVDGAQNSTR